MTYAELVSAIQAYTENDETSFVANIPLFVKLAEERIYRIAQTQVAEKLFSGTLSISVNTLTLPSDFVSPLHFVVVSSQTSFFLVPKEVSWIRAAYSSTTAVGRPRYYALRDQATLLLAPTPDAAYSYELRYVFKPTSIVSSSTSWLGDNAENALLSGALVEAYKYMKGDTDVMAMYEKGFQEGVERLKVLVEGQNRKDAFKNAEPAVGSV